MYWIFIIGCVKNKTYVSYFSPHFIFIFFSSQLASSTLVNFFFLLLFLFLSLHCTSLALSNLLLLSYALFLHRRKASIRSAFTNQTCTFNVGYYNYAYMNLPCFTIRLLALTPMKWKPLKIWQDNTTYTWFEKVVFIKCADQLFSKKLDDFFFSGYSGRKVNGEWTSIALVHLIS